MLRVEPRVLLSFLALSLSFPALGGIPCFGQTEFFGPLPYQSAADTPAIFSGTPTLEDFEDGTLVSGVTASAGMALAPSASTDSVDGDDGMIDGCGAGGWSWNHNPGGGAGSVTFQFDDAQLGYFPTAASVVWTDGEGPVTFEAFGPDGTTSLGSIGPFTLGDGGSNCATSEDRFFGVTDPGGIGAIRVSFTTAGLELDHVQFGFFIETTVVTLNAWSEADYIGGSAGNWIVAPDGLSVRQVVNGEPTYFISDFDLVDSNFSGTFQVDTASDDDFIGFVFGYQGLGASEGYYLLSWKQGSQNAFGGNGEEGLKILRIEGIPGNTQLWDGENTATTTVLAEQLSTVAGWGDFQAYEFSLSYQATGTMRVIVRNADTSVVQWDSGAITDPNPLGVGKVGFYNFSQSDVIYAGFTQVALQEPVSNPGGPYTVDLTQADITADGTQSFDPDGATTGFASIASLQWDLGNDGIADDAGRTNGTEVFTFAEVLAKGLTTNAPVPLALTVVDADGLESTTVTFITYSSVAPTADAGGPYGPVSPGDSVSLVGLVDDQDLAVGVETLTVEWDSSAALNASQVGDGFASGATATVTYETLAAFASGSTATIYLNVADASGLVEASSATVSLEAPDLTVTSVVDSGTAGASTIASVSWTVENVGSGDALGSWTDHIFVSPDSMAASGVLVGMFPRGPLLVGADYTTTESVVIPASFTGPHRFVVVTNATASLPEPGATASNTAASPSFEVTNPDLTVGAFSVPTSGFTGEALSLAIPVTNSGSDANGGMWSDRVYLSLNAAAQIGPEDTLAATVSQASDVAAGTDYTLMATATLPLVDGNYFVKVEPDASSQLQEGSGETPAVFVSTNSIAVGDAPKPNLRPIVASITHPASAAVNAQVTVDYDVENIGNLDVSTNYVERVYASVDTFIGGDVLLVENTFSTLTQGTTESRSVQFTVPDLPQGFYFVVCVDASGAIAEQDENDNCGRSTTRMDVFPPDLTASNPVVPATAIAGQDVSVTASIDNVGAAAALGPWIGRFYLSADGLIDDNDFLVGSVVELDALASGESLPISRMITIPDRIEGDYFLLLQADFFDDVNEADEGNNLGTSTAIVVSQPARPDLQVASIVTPPDGLSSFPLSFDYVVTNMAGSADPSAVASGVWLDRIEALPMGGGDPIFLGQVLRNETLADGSSYTGTFSGATYPADQGAYQIRVVVDSSDLLNEGLAGGESNNALDDPTSFMVTSFDVSVQASLENALSGTPVDITGSATAPGTGTPVPNAPITVGVQLKGTERVLSAQTDALGAYSITFQPLANEAGLYGLVAGPVDSLDPAVQDTFNLWGLSSTSVLTYSLLPNESRTRNVTLVNPSDLDLTGLNVTVSGAPAGVSVNFTAPTTLNPGNTNLPVEVTTDGTSFGPFPITLDFDTAQGAMASTTLGVTLVTPQPVLTTNPSTLSKEMLRGAQTLVEFEVSNTGGAPATDFEILLPPQFDWLDLGVGSVPDLDPGESATILLQLTPSDTLNLQPYGGGIAINAMGTGTVVSTVVNFTFEAVSDLIGDLVVKVTDESSFYVEDVMTGEYIYVPEGTELGGATVQVFGAFDQQLVAEATTDGGDYLAPFTGLAEGYYEIRVNAPNHAPFVDTVLLDASAENTVEAFLPVQSVTYVWMVEETEIEDTTIVTLENTFETFVPYPVVTIDPPLLDLAQVSGDVGQFEFTVTNTGFVSAKDLFLTFGDHPDWIITPLIEDIGDLAADTSIIVPVIVERVNSPGGGGGPCEISAGVEWRLFCIFWRYYWVPLPVLNIDCGPTVPSSGSPSGSGWISGGSSGGSPGQPFVFIPQLSSPQECDPCDPNTFDPTSFCVGIEAEIGGAVAAVLGAVEAVVPFLSDIEAAISAEGCLETCCIDGGIGLSLSASGGAGVSAEIDLAEVEFGLPSSVLTAGVGVTLELGCDIPLSLSLMYSVVRTCEGMTEVNVCLTGSAQPGCGAEVEVEVDGLGIDVDAASLQVRLGVNASVCIMDGELMGEVCFEGLWVEGTLMVPVEGAIQPVFQGQHFLIPEACFPGDGGGGGSIPIAMPAPSFEVPRQLVSYRRTPVGPAPTTIPVAAAGGGGSPEAVCAQVRLQLQQEVAITRSAFNATLYVTNETSTSTVENFLATVQVYDEAGNVVNDRFGIPAPSLYTFNAVDGTGMLAPLAQGTAQWLIVPTRDAAPMVDTDYFVGGLVSYTLGGASFVVPLEPVRITVRPDASLTLRYFWQRDVVGDDPFTTPVEPSDPFAIGLMIENQGFGPARNVRVASNQPEIVENEDGLLVSFELIGTRVGEDELTPSLTVNFGDIQSMDTVVARFLLLSSLQGQFLADYSVEIDHVDDFGNPRTSLIDDVFVYELIRVVRTDVPADDVPDFLTNEVPWPADPNEVDPTDPMTYDPDRVDVADTLRHSDGTVSSVTAFLDATVTPLIVNIVPVAPPSLTGIERALASVQVADTRNRALALLEAEYEVALAGPITDWTYLKIPSPVDDRLTLVSVTRSDNSEVEVGVNAWVTDRVFQEDDPPLNETRLHILDNQGDGVYRVRFLLNP